MSDPLSVGAYFHNVGLCVHEKTLLHFVETVTMPANLA